MRRVVSLYLPTWSTDRWRRQRSGDALSPDTPLVLAGHDGRRRVVVAADAAAQMLGIQAGLAMAQAQVRVPGLRIEPADPAADVAALTRLGEWALGRYSPIVIVDAPDGLLIDVTGAAHLFGGEAALLADLLARLNGVGITARAALAETIGAAHALARFARHSPAIAAPGETAKLLADLPLAALRLDAALIIRLRRLGFETIAALAATPRAPLALRFGPSPGQRLDQAFGRLAEAVQPLCPPELIQIRHPFAEPLSTPESLAHYTRWLVACLCEALARKGLGARRLDLLFHRVDASIQAIRIGTAKPVRDVKRLTALLTEHLETIDPGFGVEAMVLVASLAEPLVYRQGDSVTQDQQGDVSALVDTLTNRLGAGRLYRLAPVESDLPERAVRRIPPLAAPTGATWSARYPRPSRLLAVPEPVETMALLPDQPPVQFTWRGKRRRISRADGPERVFGEWWKHADETAAVRDYFVVEDETGARFWLFRSGDGETAETGDLRWYMHGIFA